MHRLKKLKISPPMFKETSKSFITVIKDKEETEFPRIEENLNELY